MYPICPIIVRPNSRDNAVWFGERFAREVRWVRALTPPLFRGKERCVQGPLRFKQSRFKRRGQAARQRRSQLGADQRLPKSSVIPAFAHRSSYPSHEVSSCQSSLRVGLCEKFAEATFSTFSTETARNGHDAACPPLRHERTRKRWRKREFPRCCAGLSQAPNLPQRWRAVCDVQQVTTVTRLPIAEI